MARCNRKRIHVLIGFGVALILLVAVLLNLSAFAGLGEFRTDLFAEKVDITIKQYATGDAVNNLSSNDAQELIALLKSNLSYAGIKPSNDSISSAENAYSIVISTPNQIYVFILSENDKNNYMYGDKIFIKLSVGDGVIKALDAYFV